MKSLEAPWVGREPPETPLPVCPICGGEAETFYYRDGECVGCDMCLTEKFYDEVEEIP